MSTSMVGKYTGALSRTEVRDFFPLAIAKPIVLISITDPGSAVPEINGEWQDVLPISVWDDNTIDNVQLDAIFTFMHRYKNGSIFAHCEAGISRSGAIKEFLDRRGWKSYPALNWRRLAPNLGILNGLSRLDWAKPLIGTYQPGDL